MWSTFQQHLEKKDQNSHNAPVMEEIMPGKCWIINNFLSEAECEAMISAGDESLDFIELSTFTRYRYCYRVKFEDNKLLHWMWKRLENFVPKYSPDWRMPNDSDSDSETDEIPKKGIWEPIELQRYPRMCKYVKSQHHFAPHFDYSVDESCSNEKRKSFLTFMLYLNCQDKSFKGGNTNFLDPYTNEITHSIFPRTGMAILFVQDKENGLLHEGTRVLKGKKYIFRTEVMFKFIPLGDDEDKLLQREIEAL